MRPLALLLLAVAAGAETNMSGSPGPGTDQPHSRTCGLPAGATLADYKSLIEATFHDVSSLALAYYKDPKNAREADEALAQEPRLVTDDIGSPAHARAPDMVCLRPELCAETTNLDELAWAVGHEIAHL